jgi:hypothetical protein
MSLSRLCLNPITDARYCAPAYWIPEAQNREREESFPRIFRQFIMLTSLRCTLFQKTMQRAQYKWMSTARPRGDWVGATFFDNRKLRLRDRTARKSECLKKSHNVPSKRNSQCWFRRELAVNLCSTVVCRICLIWRGVRGWDIPRHARDISRHSATADVSCWRVRAVPG